MITLLKLAFLIIFILALIRLKINIAVVIFFLLMATTLVFGLSPSEIKTSVIKAFLSPFTYKLAGMIITILFLEGIMEEKKLFTGLINLLSNFKTKKWALLLPPSIIGLLPMPGGALVSAPAVKVASEHFKLSPSDKTYINFWFRHLWEYWWPLYPGLLVASAVLQVPIRNIMLYLFPLSVISIISGLIFTLPLLKEEKKTERTQFNFQNFIPLLPIITIIILTLFFKINFIISLVTGTLIAILITRTGLKELPRIFYRAMNPTIISLIIFIMIYREIIITADIFGKLQNELTLPQTINYIIVTAISFTIGFLTGINQIFAGVAFPMLASLFNGNIDYRWVMLVYSFGFIGVLSTPTHLCLTLTKEYFRADWRGIYKKLIPTLLPVAGFAILYYFILTYIKL